MWLIIGLGNPGSKYQRNRHNIGFMAADALHAQFSFPAWKKKFQGDLAEGKFPEVDEKVVLLKPQTFMNLSGEAVQAAAAFYKVPPAHIVVFHDDLDLTPGQVKVKQGGRDGGHNGLSSIDTHLGQDYWRVRLGIGHPGVHEPNKGELVTAYVLSDFSKDDRGWLGALLMKITQAFPQFLSESPEKFLNALHQKTA